MGVMEQILAELQGIRAVLEGGATVGDPVKKETKSKSTKPKGPTLEQVQTKIKDLVAADEDNAKKIKAAIVEMGGKRAGDFEQDAAKLEALMEALEGIGADGEPDGDDDSDLL